MFLMCLSKFAISSWSLPNFACALNLDEGLKDEDADQESCTASTMNAKAEAGRKMRVFLRTYQNIRRHMTEEWQNKPINLFFVFDGDEKNLLKYGVVLLC